MKTFGPVVRPKAPEGYIGIWINIYDLGWRFHAGGAYDTKCHADNIAKSYRHDCVYIHVKKSKWNKK